MVSGCLALFATRALLAIRFDVVDRASPLRFDVVDRVSPLRFDVVAQELVNSPCLGATKSCLFQVVSEIGVVWFGVC